jgi:kynurenine 3-monooxygenase
MSDRGLKTLELAGIADDILRVAIPMHGRVMHDVVGNQTYQPYGVGNQAINSVSRGELNKVLLTVAERHGVEILFSRRCVDIDIATATATFEHTETGARETFQADVLFGADGSYSAVRNRLMMTDRFDYSPAEDGSFQLEKHALHIWPRHSYMMIALPNLDGSFTCTLFFAHKGSPSFDELKTRADAERFFSEQFPDAMAMMPTLLDDFQANPESSLVTVRCFPWVANGKVALIGDAAHAIVPFYGQGMNCGFEDCRVLMACLDHCNEDWTSALELYQQLRKPSGDAIAQLALDNFIEMRDKVADPVFLLRKQIEGYLYATYPDKFIPLYTLVTFSPDVAYDAALRAGREADVLLAEIMAMPDVAGTWNSEAGKQFIDTIMQQRQPVSYSSGMPA